MCRASPPSIHEPTPRYLTPQLTVASKRGYTDLPETSSRQLLMGSSSD